MIDYALAMMANPMNENDPKKAYAFLQSRATLGIDEIADHMVAHGCQYDRGDIIAIVVKLVSCSKELMLDGYRIQLGDLGGFYLSCQSRGANSFKTFTRENIKAVNVNFKASTQFADLVQKASLHRVPTRKAVAATLAAQTEGLTTADWSADNDTDNGTEGD